MEERTVQILLASGYGLLLLEVVVVAGARRVSRTTAVYCALLALCCVTRILYLGIPPRMFGSQMVPENTRMTSPTTWSMLMLRFFIKCVGDLLFFATYSFVIGFWASVLGLFRKRRHSIHDTDSWLGRSMATIAHFMGLSSSNSSFVLFFALNVASAIAILVLIGVSFLFDSNTTMSIDAGLKSGLAAAAAVGFMLHGRSLQQALSPLLRSQAQEPLLPVDYTSAQQSLRRIVMLTVICSLAFTLRTAFHLASLYWFTISMAASTPEWYALNFLVTEIGASLLVVNILFLTSASKIKDQNTDNNVA